MYHRKKIAFFISHIYGDYQKSLSQGIIDRAAEYGYRTEIYATNDTSASSSGSPGEQYILDVTNANRFDGIIFAPESYTDSLLRDKIHDWICKQQIPVVYTSEYSRDYPFVCIDNNQPVATLAEHLIQVHGYRRLCYLGSKMEKTISDQRYRYFVEIMEKHGLPLSEHCFYECDESPEDYENALQHFSSSGSLQSDIQVNFDGVICYNDRVAMAFCEVARKAGYSIPKDFAVTGCDNSLAGQSFQPALTTITFPTYDLGCSSVNLLLSLLHKEEFSSNVILSHPIWRASCGCKSTGLDLNMDYARRLTAQVNRMEKFAYSQTGLSYALAGITDLEDGIEVLSENLRSLPFFSEYYICLYPDWNQLDKGTDSQLSDSSSSVHDMELLLGLREGQIFTNCTFSSTQLIPEFLQRRTLASYVVLPLFLREKSFGYCVMAFPNNKIDYYYSLITLISSITRWLQDIYQKKLTGNLSEQLNYLYHHDHLTGLLSFEGFHQGLDNFLQKLPQTYSLGVFRFDIQKLKRINFTEGFQEGSLVLQTMGQALRRVFGEDALCAHFDGDNFFVLAYVENEKNAKDKLLRVSSYLTNYVYLNKKSYHLQVKSAYVLWNKSYSPQVDDIPGLLLAADDGLHTSALTENS